MFQACSGRASAAREDRLNSNPRVAGTGQTEGDSPDLAFAWPKHRSLLVSGRGRELPDAGSGPLGIVRFWSIQSDDGGGAVMQGSPDPVDRTGLEPWRTWGVNG